MSIDASGTGRLILGPLVTVTCGALFSWSVSVPAPAEAVGEPATTAPEPPDGVGEADDTEYVETPDAEDFTVRFDPQDFVESLGDDDSEHDEDDIVVLETDILFSPNEWELPDGAGSEIGQLAEEIPDGATVDVHGHTDSVPVPDSFDFDNQELSENRAQAVADALEEERQDLELDVEGFGDSDPAEVEDEDDPSTFAANRRVEIRYN